MPPVKKKPILGEAGDLDAVYRQIDTKYPHIRVQQTIEPVEVISSGSVSLDGVLGPGGFAKGRLIELSGAPSCGKSTLMYACIAQAQHDGLKCAIFETENTFDPQYAQNCGVDLSTLDFYRPDYVEQMWDIILDLLAAKVMGLIVVDSIAEGPTKAELEGSVGESHMALLARVMSQVVRKLKKPLEDSQTVLVCINQIRSTMNAYGLSEVTPGGYGLKFGASVRIDLRRQSQLDIKRGNEVIGIITKASLKKNKTGKPFGAAEIPIIFGKGIDRERDLLRAGLKTELIQRGGPQYRYQDQILGKGEEEALRALRGPVGKELGTRLRFFQRDGSPLPGIVVEEVGLELVGGPDAPDPDPESEASPL